MGPAKMFRKSLFALVLTFGVGVIGPSIGVADACPMCRVANESDPNANKPRAYMYSILFMLSMPMMVFAGFSFGLYRLSQREQQAVDAAQLNTDPDRV